MSRGTLRWLIVPLVVLPLGWLLFAGLGRDPRLIPSPLVGKPIPEFAGATLTGEQFSSASLAGKPAVVNFWGSYCIPSCVEEHPVLLDLAAAYGEEVAMVGVLVNDTPDDALRFLARYGQISWPTVINSDGRITIAFGVTAPPETFFVDAAGIVRARHLGPLTAATLAENLPLIGIAP